jgi:lysozyme
MREKLKKLLIEHEGWKNKSYVCTEGYVTVGVGRNLQTLGLSDQEIEYLLDNDITRVVSALDSRYHWFSTLPENRQTVIASMAFQLGLIGFDKFENLKKAITDFRFYDVPNEMKDSKWYSQTPNRVEALIEIWGE